MSTPNPGDILPLWDPDIPGEVITTGRLGIRIRPGSPAAAKVALLPGGPQWLCDALNDKRSIEIGYTHKDPHKPLECIGLVDSTLIQGRLGRTNKGLALEVADIQQLESPDYPIEKSRIHLNYQELQLVEEWDGALEGFTAVVLREEAKTAPILDSTMRFVEHLRDFRQELAEAAIGRYEAIEQWVECPRCESLSTTSDGSQCSNCGEDTRAGEYVRACLRLVGDRDGRVYRGIDSLTVRSAGFPEYRGMSLDRVQGMDLWVSFRRYDPLPDEGIVLPTASVEMFEAQRSAIRQLQIASPRTGALAALLADAGWLGSPPYLALEGRKAQLLPDPNAEQSEAVARVLGMRPGQLYLIQGPPGTGKTTAIVESIRRILSRHPNAKILLSSHSNDAVDTGQERLLGFSHVRQARIAEPGKVPRRLRGTLFEGDDLSPFNLVAGTCNRLAIDSRLRYMVFDWVILDEANKVRANEALALMPLARRWVMIGDLKQLPPVMEEAATTFETKGELDEMVRDASFYGWMWDRVPSTSRIMLPRQYRMREPIGRVVSDLFYGGKLLHEAPHQKMPLPWPFDRELVWVDTGAQDEYRDAQKSVANEFEVALCKDITSLIRRRMRKSRLAVIAMYNSQVNRLQSALKGIVPPDDIESVDAFEGREADAVILSLVRSNDRSAIGFLNDPNRVNVAISRAKKLLVIVGDSKTVIGGAPELFGPLFAHCGDDGLVAGVGAVVTACQRVGVRSQVQRLSRPNRGDRRGRRRGRRGGVGEGAEGAVAGSPDGTQPSAGGQAGAGGHAGPAGESLPSAGKGASAGTPGAPGAPGTGRRRRRRGRGGANRGGQFAQGVANGAGPVSAAMVDQAAAPSDGAVTIAPASNGAPRRPGRVRQPGPAPGVEGLGLETVASTPDATPSNGHTPSPGTAGTDRETPVRPRTVAAAVTDALMPARTVSDEPVAPVKTRRTRALPAAATTDVNGAATPPAATPAATPSAASSVPAPRGRRTRVTTPSGDPPAG